LIKQCWILQGDAMPTAEATIQTERPDRYLAQLCGHAGKMGGHQHHLPGRHADGTSRPEIRNSEWSGADGTVTLNWGQWTMHAASGTLTVRAEADSEEHLRQIQDLLTARLEKIGRRDHLTVTWQPPALPGT
jgi:hypothetical protein